MTVEEIELRKILKQMLADEGINRETLKQMVKDILEEKIERAVKQALAEKDTDATNIQKFVEIAVKEYLSNPYRTNLNIAEVVRDEIKSRLNRINITMTVEHGNGSSTSF